MKMTVKKFIEEMTQAERTEVFNKNEGLQHKVMDDMQDSEMTWIGEKLDYIRQYLADWSIGTGARCFITPITDNSGMIGLLEGLKAMDEGVPAFNDDKAAEVIGNFEKALKAYLDADAYEEDEDGADNYGDLLDAAEQAARDAADALAEQFEKDLNGNYNKQYQLDYFLEFYADVRMEDEETFYIIPEEGTYKLYEDVSYTKSFE